MTNILDYDIKKCMGICKKGGRVMTDTEIILIYAVRYVLGRQSHAVAFITNYVKDEIYRLSEQCRKTMLHDIAEQERFGYGDIVDERDWNGIRRVLKESLN